MSTVQKKYVFSFLLCGLALTAYMFAFEPGTKWLGKDSHILNLSLGAFSGFFVLIVQFLLDGKRDRELTELEQTKIKKVLESRDHEDYYRDLVKNAKREIIVFGVTARRFLGDFADENNPRQDKKVLLAALDRGVSVRLLLCEKEFLQDDSQQTNYQEVKKILTSINERLENKIEARYYKSHPSLSMVVIDDHCLVGPVFPGKASAHTPTIHALRYGSFAQAYTSHFDKQWQEAA